MKISTYIRKIRKEFSPEGDWRSINNGNCEDFAFAIREKFPDAEMYWGNEIDKEIWQEKLTFESDDIDVWMWDNAPGHCFICYKGKYYDSEIPNGVDHPADIPYYRREVRYVEQYS